MRKADIKKVEEALKLVHEDSVSILNLRKLGFTKPQVAEVQEIVDSECQKSLQTLRYYCINNGAGVHVSACPLKERGD